MDAVTPGTKFADSVLAYVRGEGLQVHYILDTHAHADHLTAAHYAKAQLNGTGKTYVSHGGQSTSRGLVKMSLTHTTTSTLQLHSTLRIQSTFQPCFTTTELNH